MSMLMSRTYKVLDGDESYPLVATWAVPFQDPDRVWRCDIALAERDEVKTLRSLGEDSVQALYLGMLMVSAHLLTHDLHVCWFDRDDDIGLPVNSVFQDVLDARSKRFKAMEWERELQRDVIRSFDNGFGRLTLNRPSALHALNTNMCRDLTETLLHWRRDVAVRAVILDHSGERGFCAGGDIRMLAESGAGDGAEAREFFHTEYRLNQLLFDYPKPIIAVMDGVTMGGGVGLSMPARYRIATERTTFAMPETGIGLFPDVGGGWFLPRLPGRTGLWLALTGARLKAADCVALGIATHFVPNAQIESFKAALTAEPHPSDAVARIEAVVAQFAGDPGPAMIAAHAAVIDACFDQPSVEAIVAALAADGGDWALAQLKTLQTKSPQTLKVAFRQLALGARMTSFADNMALEYRIGARVVRMHDFLEGVRAVIVDKDNAPRWNPASLEAVTEAQLDEIFAPLPPEQEWTPLQEISA